MNKLFDIKMTWKKVIIMAVVSALITAALNCIPLLEGTSFTAPAETTELWTLLALIIIMNCEGYKEAVLKTFVFFLVSQPLCYLFEVPFKAAGWGLFAYYKYWAIITVLTIPGAAIAYRVKKGDVLAAVILSVANALTILTGMSRIDSVLYEFPHQLLSLLFCLACPVFLIFALLKEKKSRTVASVLAAAALAAGIFMYVIMPEPSVTYYQIEKGPWQVESVSDPALTVSMESEEDMKLEYRKNGSYTITLVADDGRRICYDVVVEGAHHSLTVSEAYTPEE